MTSVQTPPPDAPQPSLAKVSLTAGKLPRFTPLALFVAVRAGAVVEPGGDRRVHARPTPLLGGVAMLVGLLVATATMVEWRPAIGIGLMDQRQLVVTLVCAVGVCAFGAADDIMELSWQPKLLGQVLLATTVVVAPVFMLPSGLTVEHAPLVVSLLDLPFVPPVELPVVVREMSMMAAIPQQTPTST